MAQQSYYQNIHRELRVSAARRQNPTYRMAGSDMRPEASPREAALRAISRQQRGILPSSALDEAFNTPTTRLICCYAALVGVGRKQAQQEAIS